VPHFSPPSEGAPRLRVMTPCAIGGLLRVSLMDERITEDHAQGESG
jgi:hypothetical protein